MEQAILNNEYDQEMAKYIWTILNSQLVIIWSWGIEPQSVRVIPMGVEFKVNGFKHKGKVRISLDEGIDLFRVLLISEEGEIVDRIEDIYFDMLVSVIDNHIEKTEDYENRISQEYGFLTE